MRKIIKEQNGYIKFKLASLLEKKGYSKNRLCVEAGLRFETVQGYCNGNISRVDLYVLAQMCKTLNCKIEDIIEYIN